MCVCMCVCVCARAHLFRCFNRFITTQIWNTYLVFYLQVTNRKTWLFTWECTKRVQKCCLSSQYDDYNSGGFPFGIPIGKRLSSLRVAVVFPQSREAFPGTKLPFGQNLFHNKLTVPLRRDSYGLASIWAAFIAPGSTFRPRRWSQLYTLKLHFSNCHYNSPSIWALDLTRGLLFISNFWHTQHVTTSHPLGH
jgi:hypothetical protein